MKGGLWQIVGDYGDDFHAGPKAKRDVTAILSREGWSPFAVNRCQFGGPIGRTVNRLAWFVQCRRLRHRLPGECALFMQYPSVAWSRSRCLRILDAATKRRKGIRLIVLFHDVPSLRTGTSPFEERALADDERDLMFLADAIIVHNEAMKSALANRGVPAEKMVTLGAFDYLVPDPMRMDRKLESTVIVAGNLAPDKCGYLKGLPYVREVKWNLYGVNFDSTRLNGENVEYRGCHSPEELSGRMEGAFGLVWDGTSAETCSGDYGDYLRINAPHKLSLYLSAGLPVIVWSQSGQAGFVKENGLGLVVEDLNGVAAAIGRLTDAEYDGMRSRAVAMGMKLRAGEFTVSAVRSARERIAE